MKFEKNEEVVNFEKKKKMWILKNKCDFWKKENVNFEKQSVNFEENVNLEENVNFEKMWILFYFFFVLKKT